MKNLDPFFLNHGFVRADYSMLTLFGVHNLGIFCLKLVKIGDIMTHNLINDLNSDSIFVRFD